MSAALTIATVADVTACAYGVTIRDMKSPRRPEPLITARHVAMYLAMRHTGCSSSGLGRWFGRRDHTTVLHAVKRITWRLDWDSELAVHVATIDDALRAIAQERLRLVAASIDPLALARRLACASERTLLHTSTDEITALAQRVIEAQHALLDAARLLRGLAHPDLVADEGVIAGRARRLAAGLEALGVIEIPTRKEDLNV